MEPIDIAYDICRCYINDHSATLGGLSTKLLGHLRARDIGRLASSGDLFDPEYHGADVFRHLRQISAFFKKNADFSNPDVCLQAARTAFADSEMACWQTNRVLYAQFADHGLMDPDIRNLTWKMERYLNRVLGPFDEFFQALPDLIRVTSGASATHSRRHSLPHLKVSKRLEASPRAAPYLDALSRFYGYGPLKVRHLGVNRVEFVPKNWKTYRTIACEPRGNLPLQLAFDRYAKKRLRRNGVDLSNQSRNQDLARIGSTDGSFATIDLSAASDTVSTSVVCGLFPVDWFRYLNNIRSTHYLNPEDNGLLRYEKFASMGNGSTFAIETLIFAAACHAVGSKAYSVYGDDIIVETGKAERLIALLAYLGFSTNEEKSYTTGPFRESCGADWFLGRNVTPFYLRKWRSSKSFLYHNVNGLAEIAVPEGHLERFLLQFVTRNALVPFNGNSVSGIYIDVHTAYNLRLLRSKNSIVRYKCLVAKSATSTVADSRTLFLWHLGKRYHREFEADCRPILDGKSLPSYVVESSRVPILSHKYRRELVCWIPPAQVTPVHLYRWTELILRHLGEIPGV